MRTLLAVPLLLASAALASRAAEPEPTIPADARKKALEELKQEAARLPFLKKYEAEQTALLAAAKVGKIDPKVKAVTVPEKADRANPVRFPNAQAKADYLAKLDEDIKRLRQEVKDFKAGKPEDFARELSFTSAGEVGRFGAKRAHVGTVIDKTTATIETRTSPPGGERDEAITVVVSGIDTAKWADGGVIDTPPGIFYVGTQKRGATTYLHLVPLKLTNAEAAAIMRAAKGEREDKK